MVLYLTISEINGDFSRKSQFSHPPVFNTAAEGIPLGIEYQHKGSKNRMMGLPGGGKSFKISSAV